MSEPLNKPKYKHSVLDEHLDNKSVHRLLDNIPADDTPQVTDDATEGYAIGSRWLFGTDLYILTDATPSAAVWTQVTSGPNGALLGRWVLRDEEQIGSNGGDFIQNVWQVRVLNTVTVNGGSSVTLNGDNSFTISNPGTYNFTISAPAYYVNNHMARLVDITGGGSTIITYGTNAYCKADTAMTTSRIDTSLSLTELNLPRTYNVQHFCASTQTVDGLGLAAGFGGNEVYTMVTIDHYA